MKHFFCINPAAGKKDTAREFAQTIRACCRSHGMTEGTDFLVQCSQKPGDITQWVKQVAQTGETLRVYACGGDGTLNEVVNGAAGHPNVAVTNIPRGSGNDFIRMFTAADPFRDIDALITTGKEVSFDLIEVGGNYAINACSMGLDARIATTMNRYKHLPLVSGHGAYLLSTLVQVMKRMYRNYRVEIDGQEISGEQTMIFVGSGRWYGGGFQPVPEADPTDGKLDVLLVKRVSRLTVARIIGPYKQGRYQEYPQYVRHFTADRVKITCHSEEPINLDGEMRLGQVAEFCLAPHKLRFFYPEAVELVRSGEKDRLVEV